MTCMRNSYFFGERNSWIVLKSHLFMFLQFDWLLSSNQHYYGMTSRIYPGISLIIMEPILTLQMSCCLTGKDHPKTPEDIATYLQLCKDDESVMIVSHSLHTNAEMIVEPRHNWCHKFGNYCIADRQAFDKLHEIVPGTVRRPEGTEEAEHEEKRQWQSRSSYSTPTCPHSACRRTRSSGTRWRLLPKRHWREKKEVPSRYDF